MHNELCTRILRTHVDLRWWLDRLFGDSGTVLSLYYHIVIITTQLVGNQFRIAHGQQSSQGISSTKTGLGNKYLQECWKFIKCI